MLAAPGAGKGTQARRLAQHHGLEHLASGDLLRAEIVAGTAVGRTAESYVNRADLVPDDVILEILGPRLKSAAELGGYVLDGFPRNRAQAERAYQMATDVGGIELQAVIHLEVEREELRRRMLARADAESRSDDTRATIERWRMSSSRRSQATGMRSSNSVQLAATPSVTMTPSATTTKNGEPQTSHAVHASLDMTTGQPAGARRCTSRRFSVVASGVTIAMVGP